MASPGPMLGARGAAVEITEVRIRLVRSPDERLKAFATVTFDKAFVVRDVKVVDGPSGLFIAMPSRKLVARCPQCKEKNHLRAKYCNGCGERLPIPRAGADGGDRVRLHVDVAHPIHTRCRESIQRAVLDAYAREAASGAPAPCPAPPADTIADAPLDPADEEGPEDEDPPQPASPWDGGPSSIE